MKRFWAFVTRQYDIGSWWGASRALYSSAMFYWNPVGVFMQVNIYYYAVRDQYLTRFFPWFNLPLFILLGVVVFFALMLFEYKFSTPSAYRYTSGQATKHYNPAFEKICDVERKVNALNEHLANIEKLLEAKHE